MPTGDAGVNSPAKAVLCLILLLTVPSPARALQGTISAIDVTGNNRTKVGLILSTIELAVGDPWADGTEAAVRQKLMNTRLFWEVTVTTAPGSEGVVLRIAVREKWTIIPLPIVVATEDRTTAGLSLMESNLLGSGSRLFVSVFNTDGDWSGFLHYMDRSLSDGDIRYSISGMHGQGEVETWAGDEVAGRYLARRTGGTIGAGYNFTRQVSISLTGTIAERRFEDVDGTAEPPEDGRERALGIALEVDRADHVGSDRDRGFRGRFRGSRDFPGLGSDYRKRSLDWQVDYSLDTWRRQTLSLAGSGTWGWHVPTELQEGLDRLRGYQHGRFRSDRAMSASIEYIVPVVSFPQIDLSLAAFLDGAFLRNRERAFTLEDGVADAGISFRIYLRRVLLPVFQIYLAYAVEDDVFRPGLSLGFSF